MKRKKAKAKALTEEDIEKLCQKLQQKDYEYAKQLDERIDEFLTRKRAIRDYSELEKVLQMKRLLLGQHTEKKVVEGNITAQIVVPPKVDEKAWERLFGKTK